MNIYCIGYDVSNVFGYELLLNDNFDVEAGKIHDFTESLYESLENYFDNSITLEEFLDDVNSALGFRPTLILTPSFFADDCIQMETSIRDKIFSNMIKLGNINTANTFLPISMCEYVL